MAKDKVDATKRYRLTARAEIDGAVREPGYEFTLPEGVRGPHRARMHSHDTVNVVNDDQRILPTVLDEPLFEEVTDASPPKDEWEDKEDKAYKKSFKAKHDD